MSTGMSGGDSTDRNRAGLPLPSESTVAGTVVPTVSGTEAVTFTNNAKTVEARLPTQQHQQSTPTPDPILLHPSIVVSVECVEDGNEREAPSSRPSTSPPPPLSAIPTTGSAAPQGESNHAAASSAAAASSSSSLTSFSFCRTLQSEIDVRECFDLLLAVQKSDHSRLLQEWSMAELQILSQILTVLKFAAGESVIEAGESSSFVAILLSGSLEVRLHGPGAPPIPILTGGLLGELSCFEGGTRTAQVRANRDSIIAILTFAELESLKQLVPDIRMKFMCMFALEGLKKLRAVLDQPNTQTTTTNEDTLASTHADAIVLPPPQPPSATAASQPSTTAAQPTMTRAQSRSSTRSESPVPTQPIVTKPPPLNATSSISRKPAANRRTTMQNFGSMNLFGPAVGGAVNKDSLSPSVASQSPSSSSSVNLSSLVSPRRMEAMFRKRGVENAAPNATPTAASTATAAATATGDSADAKAQQKHRLTNIQLVLSSHEKSLIVKTRQIDSLTQDLTRASQERKELNERITKKDATIAKKTSEIESLKEELSLQQQHASILERTVSVLESQVSGNITDANAHYVRELDAMRDRIAALEREKSDLDKELRASQSLASQQALDHTAAIAKRNYEVTELREEYAHVSTKVHQLENDAALWKAKYVDSQASLDAATQNHALVDKQLDEMAVASQQANRLFTATSERLASMTRDLHAYKKILRRLLVSVFVHNFRNRRTLNTIGIELTDLCALVKQEIKHTSLVEAASVATMRADAAGDTPLVDGDASDRIDHRSTHTLGVVGGHHMRKSSNLSTMHSHKKSSLGIAPKVGIGHLVSHSHDLSLRLQPLVEELIRLKVYWSDLSKSSFERSIELKQQTVDLTAQLAKEKQKVATLKKAAAEIATTNHTHHHHHTQHASPHACHTHTPTSQQRRQRSNYSSDGTQSMNGRRPSIIGKAHHPPTHAHASERSASNQSQRPATSITELPSADAGSDNIDPPHPDVSHAAHDSDVSELSIRLQPEFDSHQTACNDEHTRPATSTATTASGAAESTDDAHTQSTVHTPPPHEAQNNTNDGHTDADISNESGDISLSNPIFSRPHPTPPSSSPRARSSRPDSDPSSLVSSSPLSPRRKKLVAIGGSANQASRKASAVEEKEQSSQPPPPSTATHTHSSHLTPSRSTGGGQRASRTPASSTRGQLHPNDGSQSARASAGVVTLPAIGRSPLTARDTHRTTKQPYTPERDTRNRHANQNVDDRKNPHKDDSTAVVVDSPRKQPPAYKSTSSMTPLDPHHTYSQVSLHSSSPYIPRHVVHGILSSTESIYSQSRRPTKHNRQRSKSPIKNKKTNLTNKKKRKEEEQDVNATTKADSEIVDTRVECDLNNETPSNEDKEKEYSSDVSDAAAATPESPIASADAASDDQSCAAQPIAAEPSTTTTVVDSSEPSTSPAPPPVLCDDATAPRDPACDAVPQSSEDTRVNASGEQANELHTDHPTISIR